MTHTYTHELFKHLLCCVCVYEDQHVQPAMVLCISLVWQFWVNYQSPCLIHIKCGLFKPLLFTVSKAAKEERARKEQETVEIPAVTPAIGNRLRETSVSVSVHRTRSRSQMFTRQATPHKTAATAPQEVKRERWSQRREMKQRLEEAK
jgi:hypothetical protein